MTNETGEKYKIELTGEELDFLLELCIHKLDYGGNPLVMIQCVALYEKLLKIMSE